MNKESERANTGGTKDANAKSGVFTGTRSLYHKIVFPKVIGIESTHWGLQVVRFTIDITERVGQSGSHTRIP